MMIARAAVIITVAGSTAMTASYISPRRRYFITRVRYIITHRRFSMAARTATAPSFTTPARLMDMGLVCLGDRFFFASAEVGEVERLVFRSFFFTSPLMGEVARSAGEGEFKLSKLPLSLPSPTRGEGKDVGTSTLI